MNPSAEFPDSPEADLHLAQVDPPHPFKSGWKTFVIAAAVLTLALLVFIYFIRRPPVAAGEILAVNLYPVHSTINGGGGEAGMQGDSQPYDQLLILAKVRIRNQTNIPLFLQDLTAVVTTEDGAQQMNVAASTRDFNRVFDAFPSLAALRADPFDRDATLSPGQSAEGLAIFNFPLTRQQWDSRKSASVVISLIHQKNLLLPFPD